MNIKDLESLSDERLNALLQRAFKAISPNEEENRLNLAKDDAIQFILDVHILRPDISLFEGE